MFSVSSEMEGSHHAPASEAVSSRQAAVTRGVGRRVDEAQATVDALLAACRALMRRDGVLDVNVRELLALAGVSNRAFYRYFPTKEALVAAVADEVYHNLLRAQAAAVANVSDPVEQLRVWIDVALSRAVDPEMASQGRVFVAREARLREQHPDLHRSVGRTMSNEVLGIVVRGIVTGAFAAGTGVAEARLIVRLTIATLQQHVLAGTTPSAAERDALVAFVVAACRCPRSPSA
jgi:AcrR family transcriptional regulator